MQVSAPKDPHEIRRGLHRSSVPRSRCPSPSPSPAASPSGCTALSWTYDRWGNRTAQTTTGGSCPNPTASYSGGNNRMDGYSYDAAGNVINDGAHTYAYDAENRMISVDAGTDTYIYDAEGKRVERITGPNQLHYWYDTDGNVRVEWTQNSVWNDDYVYLGGELVAELGGPRFHHNDHLGSTRAMTDANGNEFDWADYLPYGEIIAGGGSTTHKFTGDERDSETNSTRLLRPDAFNRDHTLFRQYSSSLGRWSSPDPLAGDISDPQSLNRYAYVGNNPLGYTDPLGADEMSIGYCDGTDFDQDPFTGQKCVAPITTMGDLCERGNTCGGGGGGFSISVNFGGLFGGTAPFGETNGLPPGVSVPPITLRSLVFGNSQCEFGPCSPASSGFMNCSGGGCPQYLTQLQYLDSLQELYRRAGIGMFFDQSVWCAASGACAAQLINTDYSRYKSCTAAAGHRYDDNSAKAADAADYVDALHPSAPEGLPGDHMPDYPNPDSSGWVTIFTQGWASHSYSKALKACTANNPLAALHR